MKRLVTIAGLLLLYPPTHCSSPSAQGAAPAQPQSAQPQSITLLRPLAKQPEQRKERFWVALSVAIADGKLEEVQKLVPHRIGRNELNDAELTPVKMAENVQDDLDAIVEYLQKGQPVQVIEPAEWSANYREINDALGNFATLTLEGDRGKALGALGKSIKKVILLGMPWDHARDQRIEIEISEAQVQRLRDKLSRIRKEIGPQQEVVERKLALLEAGLSQPESASPEPVRPKPRRVARKKDWANLEQYIRTGYLTGVQRLVPAMIKSTDKMPDGKTVLEAAQSRQEEGRQIVNYLSLWTPKHAEIGVIMDKIIYPNLKNNRVDGAKEAVARVNDFIEQIEDSGGNLQARDPNGKTLHQRIQVIVKMVGTIPDELSEAMKELISELTPNE